MKRKWSKYKKGQAPEVKEVEGQGYIIAEQQKIFNLSCICKGVTLNGTSSCCINKYKFKNKIYIFT